MYLHKLTYLQVWKARRSGSLQTVAVKLITKHGKNEKDLRNLRQEIEILRKLQHPNIIAMLDSFETKNDFCVVTEFAQGAWVLPHGCGGAARPWVDASRPHLGGGAGLVDWRSSPVNVASSREAARRVRGPVGASQRPRIDCSHAAQPSPTKRKPLATTLSTSYTLWGPAAAPYHPPHRTTYPTSATGELFHILEDDRCLPEDVVRSVARQLVQALHYLHSNRIIHRDMKPQNILIRWALNEAVSACRVMTVAVQGRTSWAHLLHAAATHILRLGRDL